eukprot:CAMPEP_0183745108 /NCGR_PEP_ID=MMETSP0737-20130205/66074_1 /TAXON_ID=385413 /ORGANISM="Thalassiosira miniscula, Strain CCMP1093" /LENGTH=476 /DNA_ID=CAMNT_0025980767 /DNA_START=222 /DNA_END=1649 /DNA_ORIENTATION=-
MASSSTDTLTLPPNVQSLVAQAKDLFERSFGSDSDTDSNSNGGHAHYYCASAPGRVNLIGEHTDYTGGYVLPLAIGYNTVAYGRGGIVKTTTTTTTSGKNDDDNAKSRIVSLHNTNAIVEFTVTPSLSPSEEANKKWANYVQGVILQYLPDLLAPDETFVLDAAFAGDVPLGSGLSSSASLEVATAVLLEGILGERAFASCSKKEEGATTTTSTTSASAAAEAAMSQKEIKMERAVEAFASCSKKEEGATTTTSTTSASAAAEAAMSQKEIKMERAVRCQRAENTFCNVPCGIMDQFVSSAGSSGRLLLIDCRSLDFREVSVGGGGRQHGDDETTIETTTETTTKNNEEEDTPVLVVANSCVTHDLGAGEYPVRVRQCREATDILARVNPNIRTLRDATVEDIDNAVTSQGLEGVLLRRARHVVTENARTVATATALEGGDWNTVGKLMNESHSSMRDDYEVSCDEIDALVDLARG